MSSCDVTEYEQLDCMPNSEVESCPYSIYTYEAYYDTYCLPDAQEALDDIMAAITQSQSTFATMAVEVMKAREMFVYIPFVACIVSLVYVYLLKCFAKPLIYLSIVLVLVIFVAGGYYSYSYKDEYDVEDDMYKYSLWVAYVFWGLAAIYLLIVCCCHSRIKLAGSIVQASSDFFA